MSIPCWSKQATAPRIDAIPESSGEGAVGPHKLQSLRPDVWRPFFHRLPQRPAEGSRAHPPTIGVKSGDSKSDPALSGRQFVQDDAAEIDEAAAEGWKTERSQITLILTALEQGRSKGTPAIQRKTAQPPQAYRCSPGHPGLRTTGK